MKSSIQYRWVMLALAFLTAFEYHFLFFSFSQLFSEIRTETGLLYAPASLIFSISTMALIPLRIPWGLLCDRIGSSATLKLAMIFIGFFGVLRGFALTYEMLLISQLFLGVGFAAILPSLAKLAEAWFPTKVGSATGFYAMGFPAGDIAALVLTPFALTVVHSWRSFLFVQGISGLVTSALIWAFAKEPLKSKVESATAKTALRMPSRKEYLRLLQTREIWVLTGLCICAMGCYDTLVLSLPDILKFGGVAPEVAGLTASLLPLGFLVAGPAIGSLSDKVGLRRPFLWILGIISGPAILAIAFLSGFPLWVAVFAAGFGTAGILTLVLVILIELPETSGVVASSAGLIFSLGNVGPFLFPIGVGYTKDITGSFVLAIAMLAVIAEITLVLGLTMRETGRNRVES